MRPFSGALRDVPVPRIVDAISDAAERWSDADFPPRVRATDAIVRRMGYSVPVVEYALDRLFTPIAATALRAVIEAELGSLAALDRFVDFEGKSPRRALPVGRVAVVASRSTIGVALVPAIFALCAKCDVVVKDREDGAIGAFFATLHEEHAAFATAALAESWCGDETGDRLVDFACVVAFGATGTLREIRARCDADARFVGFGTRASVGYLDARTIADARALDAALDGAARDIVLYDTEGCLSLHAIFIEAASDDAARVTERLTPALQRAAVEFPLGERAPEAAARFAAARDAASFRAASGHGDVYADTDHGFAVISATLDEPPPFAPRTTAIVPVRDPGEALAYLRRHSLELEAFAVAEPNDALTELAIASGASRIASFGRLQAPPLGADHGGRPRMADFIRWIDREM